MQCFKKLSVLFVLTTFFLGLFTTHAKVVLPRITHDSLHLSAHTQEEAFDHTKKVRIALVPVTLLGAFITYKKWDKIKSFTGDPLSACNAVGRDICNVGIGCANRLLWIVGRSPMDYYVTPVAPDVTLSQSDIVALKNFLSYFSLASIGGGLARGYINSMLMRGVTNASRYVFDTSAKDVRLFMRHSTHLSKVKSDFKNRYEDMQHPLGQSAVLHYREIIETFCESIIYDVEKVIAFMSALSEYDGHKAESLQTQIQFLIDEINSSATIIEYKLEEFDVISSIEKRQKLLKEVITESLNSISMLEAEVNAFVMLTATGRG